MEEKNLFPRPRPEREERQTLPIMWVGDCKAHLDEVDPEERRDRAWGIVNQPLPRSPPARVVMPTTSKETMVGVQVASLIVKLMTEGSA